MKDYDFYIVPTPIGNLKDITLRAIEVLNSVDVIACEDIRVTQKLLNHYDIKTRCISYHKFNEKERIDLFLKILSNGEKIALVSDAGTPLFCDPGAVIVKELKNLGLYTKKNLAVGLNIYTSFSTKVTDIVYQILQQFRPNTDTQAAILVLKPYTNQILAMAGSFSVEDEYNRALMSVRQVGSTIKPCIYYMALDYGFTPISKFKSEKTTFHIEGIGDYSPQNSNHVYANRDITMIEAVAVSDNIYSTKTLLFLGTSKLNDFLSLFGVDANNEVPSAALGVHELTLLQLASIYNTFASEGKYYEPKFIQKVTDKRGKVLYQAKQTGKQILNPATTLILNQLLRAPFDANAQGYATPTLLNYQPDAIYAAKTGSTLQDSLVVAYNPNYTIAVWVGKDNNEPLYETSLSRKMFEYQRNIRNAQIERAKSILETNSVEKRKKGPNDVMRFIKNTSDTNYEIDIEKIAEEEKYDGFYALATNLMDEDVKEIININSNRYKIEDCFRILKTNFETRPVYHRLENRIIAHFMICYTALLIYRLLENKLLKHGYHFTINDILNTLKKLNVTLKGFNYETLYDNSIIVQALNDTFDINLGYDCFSYKNLNNFFKKI